MLPLPKWRTRRRRRRGAVAVFAAVALPLLLVLVVFAVDVGYIVLARTQLQSAADSAALAGAAVLNRDKSAVRATASQYAELNMAAGCSVELLPDEDIELGIWDKETRTFSPVEPAFEDYADSVRVTCRRNETRGNALHLFFAHFLGEAFADVRASAVARAEPVACGAFIGLEKADISGGSYTDSYNSINGPYSHSSARNGGDVCSNRKITLSGSSIVNGNARPGPGYAVSMSGSATVTGSTNPRTELLDPPPVDPGDAAKNNDNDSIPPSDGGKNPVVRGKFTLSGTDHVRLPPGTYYFSRFTLSGGSTCTVSDRTIIYCTGDFAVSGGSIANISYVPSNLQIYCTGKKVDISGGSSFYGVVYAPESKVVRSSSGADFYGMALGKELSFTGGGGAHYDEALGPLAGSQPRPTLVQ